MVKNLREIQDARDMGSIPALGRSLGIGNGNPLQHSCLENSMVEESRGLQRVRHYRACVRVHARVCAHAHTHTHTHAHTHTEHKLLVNAFAEEVMVLSESPNILSRTVPEKSSQAKEGGIAKLC